MSKWYKGKRVIPKSHNRSDKKVRISQPRTNNRVPKSAKSSTGQHGTSINTILRQHNQAIKEQEIELKQKRQELYRYNKQEKKRKRAEKRAQRALERENERQKNKVLDMISNQVMVQESEKQATRQHDILVRMAALQGDNYDTLSDAEKEIYYRAYKELEKYDTMRELSDALNSPSTSGISKIYLDIAHKFAHNNPWIFNKYVDTEVPPNDTNTAQTSTLVYDSVITLIRQGLDSGVDWYQWLADNLMDEIDEEITTYGFDAVVKSMELADGELIAEVDAYIFDSENRSEKEVRLEHIMMLIHGGLSEEDYERIKGWNTLLEDNMPEVYD